MAEIRKYRETDIDDVFAIYTRSREKGSFLQRAEVGLDSFKQLIEDEELYLAIEKEVPVGFVSIFAEQSFIHHLYVLPQFQRRGFGKALMSHIGNKYEHPLSLKCEKENKPAVSFYKKSGWKIFKKGSEIDGTEYILMTLDFN